MAVEIEIRQICDGLVGSACGDLPGPHEASETLDDFDVHEVGGVQLVSRAKELGLYPSPKRRLEEELQQG
jgi:hypothetical protein